MKRITAMTVSLLIAIAMVGCGSENGSDSKKETETTVVSEKSSETSVSKIDEKETSSLDSTETTATSSVETNENEIDESDPEQVLRAFLKENFNKNTNITDAYNHYFSSISKKIYSVDDCAKNRKEYIFKEQPELDDEIFIKDVKNLKNNIVRIDFSAKIKTANNENFQTVDDTYYFVKENEAYKLIVDGVLNEIYYQNTDGDPSCGIKLIDIKFTQMPESSILYFNLQNDNDFTVTLGNFGTGGYTVKTNAGTFENTIGNGTPIMSHGILDGQNITFHRSNVTNISSLTLHRIYKAASFDDPVSITYKLKKVKK